MCPQTLWKAVFTERRAPDGGEKEEYMSRIKIRNIVGVMVAVCILSLGCYADEAVSSDAGPEDASAEQNDNVGNEDGRADIDGIGDTSSPIDDLGKSSSSGNRSDDQPQITPVKKKRNESSTVSVNKPSSSVDRSDNQPQITPPKKKSSVSSIVSTNRTSGNGSISNHQPGKNPTKRKRKRTIVLTLPARIQMTAGSSRRINSLVSVRGDTIKSVFSSKPKIVAVRNGKLKAKKAGRAKITVRTRTGQRKSFTVVVKKRKKKQGKNKSGYRA